MCRTEQVLLLSDDLTRTLINTSFNFGLKIKAFSRGEMFVSSNSVAKNVSYRLKHNQGGHFSKSMLYVNTLLVLTPIILLLTELNSKFQTLSCDI